jgi:hypothetical protein
MKRGLLIAALVSMCLPLAAHAEIVKTATADCKTGAICLHWWPKVVVPDGWRQAPGLSAEENANFLVPEKAVDTRVFIYANAADSRGQAGTRDGFIADDIAAFTKNNPGIVITELAPMTTADNQTLRVFRFDPGSSGRWEIAAYGEETDKDGNRYYLDFVLSGKTEALREQNLEVFRAVVAAYRK